MPKHAIKIPALRAGRKVRWMFEVSADVGEGVVRTEKPSKKAARPKSTTRGSRPRTLPKRSLKDADAKPTGRPTPAVLGPPLPSRTSGREMLLAFVIGVVFVAATTIALVGYPSVRVGSETRNTPVAEHVRLEASAQPVEVTTPARAATLDREFVAQPPAPKIVEKPKPTPIAPMKHSAAAYVPPAPPSSVTVAPVTAPPPAPESLGPERSTTASPSNSATNQAVTISGCLEMTVDENQFRLTNTEGADAPKARSWKSGFLKKGSAPVELLDFSDAPTLRNYVGHRVVATGLLSGRQLRVRSVQGGGSSCD